MRPRQFTLLAFLVFLLFCAYSLLPFGRSSQGQRPLVPDISKLAPQYSPESPGPVDAAPPSDREPKSVPKGSHPIWHLITDGERELEDIKSRQSRSLQEAVTEYRKRYGIPPPPNFDKWYQFAKSKNVQLIDEFDTINELITPFWGLKPTTIRARAKEALGFGNALLGVQIRRSNISNIGGGNEWMRTALQGMMAPFIEHLPSMDLCFNIHDEPRVVVPHEDMARLVETAKTVNMPAANAVLAPRNSFTKKPKGLNEGSRFEESKVTRFNVFPHQPTWTHSRMSCPPDSPARILEEDDRYDALGRYGLGELGFVYNETAMSDICLSPSLSSTYGFFERPNAYNIVHDLFPIFSQSKISSYADILYPSPWYWFEKVKYDEERDMPWAQKNDALYWRGSTTGGFSRNGGWRRQHRQRFVQKINAADQAKILANKGDDVNPDWEVKEVPRGDYKGIMDVYFSHIGQCDPGDCDAQKEFFTVQDRADQQDAWGWKYLLDIDGNAFSGRFYAFLQSRSLVYKFAIFREWHFEWLKPWVHYIPLSLQGDDWLEAVRFFGDGTLGKKEAERMAMQGRDWANKVLRKEDMEVWFFRLLLEYGRVIDDDRDKIGFALDTPSA
ncbi:Beta-1,2-xylosyltransferase 1 [Pleurostoma richardsiae]|uniref:Beta-1,2-xylosyltransferase 1 n=1 Tax=Pleurostoma richardsiae TaxID=41990 RepID=A0AA38VIP2_9PEZI|nr:Beta-1,2-xylosyltransferase 1 [Pleurostoma richardsiae]